MSVIDSEEPRCLGDRDDQVRHFVKFRADALQVCVGVQDGDTNTTRQERGSHGMPQQNRLPSAVAIGIEPAVTHAAIRRPRRIQLCMSMLLSADQSVGPRTHAGYAKSADRTGPELHRGDDTGAHTVIDTARMAARERPA